MLLGLGLRVSGLGFRVLTGLGFRVWGLRVRFGVFFRMQVAK